MYFTDSHMRGSDIGTVLGSRGFPRSLSQVVDGSGQLSPPWIVQYNFSR
jgi:hypothetical protein